MKIVTAMAWAAVCTAGVLFACSSSNSSSSGNAFPFSGPSCPQGSQPMQQGGNQACSQCAQSHCSGQTQCISSDCSGYFTCFCACAMGDFTCYGTCMMSAACNTCFQNVTSCEQQNCSSECTGGGSSGSGSSGGASSGSGGTTPTGSCAQLAMCCNTAGLGASCSSLTGTNNQSICQQTLAGFQDAGLCH